MSEPYDPGDGKDRENNEKPCEPAQPHAGSQDQEVNQTEGPASENKIDSGDKIDSEDKAEKKQRRLLKKVPGKDPGDTKNKKSRPRRFCFMCGRPEEECSGMLELPNNLCVCNDCLQRSLTTVEERIKNGDMTPGDMMRFPGFQIFTSGGMSPFGEYPGEEEKHVPSKAEEPDDEEYYFDFASVPAPHRIKASLDEHVIGQERAKKIISVAVYNHYKRVCQDASDGVEIEKSNILMVGPTGCGKTYLVKTLAKLLDVPLAIADATSLTEAGYIGDDIESVVSKLLAAADNDVERAEHGIIFIDEIDKLAKKKDTTHRDVNGEAVQQGLLKLLEGSRVDVPVGGTSKNAMVPLVSVDTSNILFICGGAFPDIENVIKERLNKQASIGFYADLKDKYDNDPALLQKLTVDDLRNYGMIPEFMGRLPILCPMDMLSEDMLVRILVEPKNAIIKQYQKLLAMDEVSLEFEEGALHLIAEKGMEKKTGARSLRAILEQYMLDIMFEIPKDPSIGKVVITRDYLEGTGGPRISLRGQEA